MANFENLYILFEKTLQKWQNKGRISDKEQQIAGKYLFF